ncbi:MAG: GreA/GreB family elongation factor [Oligoflexia bacterium]|nr:GreA/GreB family elongation factor [Oligoflexia bacterium]
MQISKTALLNRVKESLEESLEVIRRSSDVAKAAATHEENKAEDQYDTRGLEASYLAGAQEARANEMLSLVKVLDELFLKIEDKSEFIKVGSLVLAEEDGQKKWYFLLPVSLGKSLLFQNQEIFVISFQSPLAKVLLGKKVNDDFIFETKKEEKEFSILEIY